MVPALDSDWNDVPWSDAPTLQVAEYHPNSSSHRPITEAKMLYDDTGLHGVFRVEDCHIICRNLEYQSPVYKDSCVEFFAKPKEEKGYFNFEMNCSGTLLLQYIEDPARTPDGFASFIRVPKEIGGSVRVQGAFSGPIETEITEPLEWNLSFFIPFRVFETYAGPLGCVSGQVWRANFHKCADESSHPHWGAWSRMADRLDFHNPDQFGILTFE